MQLRLLQKCISLYTPISELKLGLFVVHSVQTEPCRSDAEAGQCEERRESLKEQNCF